MEILQKALWAKNRFRNILKSYNRSAGSCKRASGSRPERKHDHIFKIIKCISFYSLVDFPTSFHYVENYCASKHTIFSTDLEPVTSKDVDRLEQTPVEANILVVAMRLTQMLRRGIPSITIHAAIYLLTVSTRKLKSSSKLAVATRAFCQ